MTTDRLVVDVGLVSGTASDLNAIVAEFDTADTYADAVADAVGVDELADAVRSFAHGWKVKRGKLHDSIANLAELTSAVATELAKADKDLADSVKGKAS
ncbi:MAG: hypothetical protein FWF90_03455 [Promicromonosporaceae bacterium]|nr:hypothetical protein [Promicromonosporaceae bacterium]